MADFIVMVIDCINIKATNIDLTEALESHVNEKMDYLEKLIDKNDESVLCDVEIGVTTKHHQSGEIFKAQVNLHTAEHNYHSQSEKDDLYLAVNEAKDELANSIKQYRDKHRTLKRRGDISIKKRIKGLKKPQ